MPAASPSVLRVAAPNFNASSQNTTRTPRGAVENGTKPTLTASGIGKSSKNRGCRWVGNPPGGFEMFSSAARHIRQEHGPGHYDLSAAALPSVGRGWEIT